MSHRKKIQWIHVKLCCWMCIVFLLISMLYLTSYLLPSLPTLSDADSTYDQLIASGFIEISNAYLANETTTIITKTVDTAFIDGEEKNGNTYINETIQAHDLSPLYDNPFKLPKCRHALPDKYGVDPEMLPNMTRKCSLFSGVFTRENWKTILDNQSRNTCPRRQRSAIRSHDLVLKMHRDRKHRQTPPKNLTWLADKYPIYFMIAKSGSTSILGYLRRYNRIFGYDKYGDIGHDKPVIDGVTVIQSACSFTFVRDPV
eukprot:403659_1